MILESPVKTPVTGLSLSFSGAYSTADPSAFEMPVPGRRSRIFFYFRGQVNSALEAAMIVWKYILLITCLGIGVALCVGAISILRSPPDNGPPAWFAAVFGAMFFWGAFALARWRHQ